MHLNPSQQNAILLSSDGFKIELVENFKYLGGYTDSYRDLNSRIAQAWSAVHVLDRIWKSNVKKETKMKVFKASVETILL